MCLYTNQEKPKTATRPIRCMKVVRRIDGEEGYQPVFCSFNDIVYRIGETARILPLEVEKFMRPIPIPSAYDVGVCEMSYGIETGLHSYTYGNKNVLELVLRNRHMSENVAVLECEIPEGALYYKGYSNVINAPHERGLLTETSYCSGSLRVIREVPLSEISSKFSKSGGKKCV